MQALGLDGISKRRNLDFCKSTVQKKLGWATFVFNAGGSGVQIPRRDKCLLKNVTVKAIVKYPHYLH